MRKGSEAGRGGPHSSKDPTVSAKPRGPYAPGQAGRIAWPPATRPMNTSCVPRNTSVRSNGDGSSEPLL